VTTDGPNQRAEASIFSTEAGIQSDCNEHFENAVASIRVSFDPGAKVNEQSLLHSHKHFLPNVSTDAGIQIACNEHFAHAWASIRVSFDPDSKVNEQSLLHSQKQFSRNASTDAGIQIDCSVEPR
jgi:hypothetical protein